MGGGLNTSIQEFSYRNPIFIVTWKYLTSEPSMYPRISSTSNQSRWRSVADTVRIPLWMAASTPSVEVPTTWVMAYV